MNLDSEKDCTEYKIRKWVYVFFIIFVVVGVSGFFFTAYIDYILSSLCLATFLLMGVMSIITGIKEFKWVH